MGAQPLSKKRGLMNRLRQVRSAALPASTRMCASGNDEKPSVYAATHKEMDTSQPDYSDERARRSAAKGRSVHDEGALDVEELNTKLANYALTSGRPQRNANGDHEKTGDGRDAPDDESLEPESTSQGSEGTAPHLQPPGQAEEPGPSDYEMFMREAEEDDRRDGRDRVHWASGKGREPPLNSFYSNNWAARSEPTEKLAEIQESDEDGAATTTTTTSGAATPTDSAVGPALRRSSRATDATDRDGAARFSLPRAHTEPCGQGGSSKHVQWRNAGEAGERVGGRRGSGASCGQRLKSPPRPVRRQKSMMKTITHYIRLPRD